MNERQTKKTLKRLYGRNPAFEIMLCITITFLLAFLFVFLWFLQFIVPSEEDGIILILLIVLLVEAAYILSLLVRHYKHSARLKEKYNELPPYRKEELLRLAKPYKRKHGTRFNENYIYGIFTESRGHRKLPNVSTFLYVDLSEIAWIYVRTESMMTWSPYGAMGSSAIRTPQSDQIIFYTHNGTCYKGSAFYTDTDALFAMIRKKSPACKFGYKKEWENLYK